MASRTHDRSSDLVLTLVRLANVARDAVDHATSAVTRGDDGSAEQVEADRARAQPLAAEFDRPRQGAGRGRGGAAWIASAGQDVAAGLTRIIDYSHYVTEIGRWDDPSRPLGNEVIRVLDQLGRVASTAVGTVIDHLCTNSGALPVVLIDDSDLLTELELTLIRQLPAVLVDVDVQRVAELSLMARCYERIVRTAQTIAADLVAAVEGSPPDREAPGRRASLTVVPAATDG